MQSQHFARAHSDHWLEAKASLNLSAAALQDYRLDQALDWSESAYNAAMSLDAQDLAQVALGNLGWAYFGLGDYERALGLFLDAERRAAKLGDVLYDIRWLTTAGYVYTYTNRAPLAKQAYQHALQIARRIGSKEDISDITTDLALVAIASGKSDEAEAGADQAFAMAKQSGSRPDMMDAVAIKMQAAALRGDAAQAKDLLEQVEAAPESQTSMKWASELAMARMYESQGQLPAAQNEYATALATFETARAQLKREDSQLPFVANATRIYDDYIHFLVQQGKTDEALLAADQSRARTLSQGLGIAGSRGLALSPQAVARKAKSTLLFYWLGEKQSYLWAITPAKTTLYPLPAQAQITPLIDRYSKALLGPEDPIAAGNADGRTLYAILVAPAASLIPAGAPVMILADGPLSKLNFETLIASANPTDVKPHYWIEDATLIAAPSLAMLAAAQPAQSPRANILLLGDAIYADPNYPQLPYASVEIEQVGKHFRAADRVIFAREQATPATYLNSDPKRYAYIHFVSHGVASQTDPLDSAIILSRGNAAEDSFKLYARDIMRHPIDARLVTISACYGSGTRAYAGEGLVGLSWAFLHAGAHNAIGALWEANDRSTAQLMDTLYQGLENGDAPGVALRRAKLAMLHAPGSYSKPFYWAAFQMYSRL